jgi:Family of unknown function (DUF6518)
VDRAFWCLVGFIAGVFLGVIACWIGRPGWLAASAAAFPMALILTGAYHWYERYSQVPPLALAAAAVVIIAVLGHRSWRQIAAGYVLTPVLDLAHQVLPL